MFQVCSFIWVVFLCLFIIFLIVFEVSFSQASRLNSFFLLVSALVRVGPVVSVSFVQGEICAELFVCFSSAGQGRVAW